MRNSSSPNLSQCLVILTGLLRSANPHWRDKSTPLCGNSLRALLALRQRLREPLTHFFLLVLSGAQSEARRIWNEKTRGVVPVVEMMAGLGAFVDKGNLHFLRTLIRESDLDDELLPLVVAMDHLETGDRSPLEKLSAEIRPIAEEIVAELQKKLPAVGERSAHKAHA